MDDRTVSCHMCLTSGLSVHKQLVTLVGMSWIIVIIIILTLVTLVGACSIDCQARTKTCNHHLNKCLSPVHCKLT